MKPSQNDRILAYLRKGKSLTPLEALRLFGSFRLGARVYELKRRGHAIHSSRIPVGKDKRVASYSLISEARRG